MSGDKSDADRQRSAPQWAEARRWFAKATEDLNVALLAVGADTPLLDPAAYHCQQAAEKLFKGLIVASASIVPKTHDLELLATILISQFPRLSAEIKTLGALTPWGTATRYPDLEPDLGLTPTDIHEAIGNIGKLQAAIDALEPR